MAVSARILRPAALLVAALLLPVPVFLAQSASADTAPPASTPSTVSADPLPTTQTDGVVWTQIVVGNTVFVGGDFTTARPAGAAPGTSTVPRADMLAYNLSTGELINGFAPSFNAQVKALVASADGKTIYAVGSFTQVNGTAASRIVALDSTTGAIRTGFKGTLNGVGAGVAISGGTLYVGGAFTAAGGATRARAAAFNATTGALLPWAPQASDGYVRAIVVSPDGSKAVLGGSFTSLNGSTNPGQGLGAVDTTTGASLPWKVGELIKDHGEKSSIMSLYSDGINVYGTGYVANASYGNLEGSFNASWADGTINWIEDCHGDTYSIAGLGDAVYIASHSHYCGNIGGFPQTSPDWTFQRALSFSKAATGTITADPYGYYNYAGQPSPSLLTWYPDLAVGTYTGQSQAAWSVAAGNGYVVYGGEFPSVNGQKQAGLVRFAVKDLATNKQGPRVSSSTWPGSAVSLSSGTARVSWPANYDRDNASLHYAVYRSGTTAPVFETDAISNGWWSRPQMGFVDKGLTPGADYTYKVKATDPFGNAATSASVTVTVSATGPASSSYGDAVVGDGATDFWRFDEANGPSVYDHAGYSDMTAGSGVTFGTAGATSDGDTAATFSGAADSSGIAATQTAIPGPKTFSVEAWFRTTSTAGGKIVGFGNAKTGNSGSYDRHVYLDGSGHVLFGVYPGFSATVSSGGGYNDGAWHQVVASLGSNGMQLSVDGRLVAQRADVTSAQAYNGYWRVGGDSSWSGANYFAGAIDDVAVYPAPLSKTAVRNHWQLSGHGTSTPAPTDAYGAAVVAAQPDLYWRLDDATGTRTVADTSGNGDGGTVQGGVGLGSTGIRSTAGTAATFDGSSGLVVASQAVTDPEVYSEALWFKTTTTRGGKLIGFGDASSGLSSHYDRHVWMLNSGQLSFGVYDGSTHTVTSDTAFNDGSWHQMVATQSAQGIRLYVDGALVGSSSQSQAESYSGYWRIGGDTTWGGNDSSYFAGALDEVAVYSDALTASQVADQYSLGLGRTNQAPSALFTAKADGSAVSFDASGSTDPDGSIASYGWSFGDGSTGTGSTPQHTYGTPGSYSVTLTVTDDRGATAQSVETVTVVAPNAAPTASFTASTTGLSTVLDASGSTDADGTVDSYSWDFGDGATATGRTASHSYAVAGSYTVTLTVSDDDGAKDTATRTVVATAPNPAPVAAFTSTVAGQVVELDASASSDDGSITSYRWDFGDGATGTGATTQHTYSASGDYVVSLTVTDDQGATASVSHTVTVRVAAGTVATDSFERTVASGLGSADTGGSWTIPSGASRFAARSGSGVVSVPAGSAYVAYLKGVSSQATDVVSTVTFSALPTGGAAYAGLVGRLVGSDEYSARAVLRANGQVSVELLRRSTVLATGSVPGVTYTPGQPLKLRVQVNGASPTTIRARVWNAAATEPSVWQATTTDSTAGDQVAGSIGLRASVSSAVTAGAVTVGYDDLVAVSSDGAAAPVNAAPIAAFTSSSDALTTAFDASGSTDSDGTVAGYAWDFGDGSTGSGAKPSHTFQAAGTFTVKLTVTDDDGAAGTATKQVTVTAPPAATAVAADAFARSVTGGLGSADTGGAWTLSGSKSMFSVADGVGRLTIPAAGTASAYLTSTSASAVDESVTLSVPALPSTGTVYGGLIADRVGSDDYRARVTISASGAVNLQLFRGATSLKAVKVSGITYTAGSALRLRFVVSGAGSVSLQARAWLVGTAEPTAWQASATDASGLQGSGYVGIYGNVSKDASTTPVVVSFDDLSAVPVP